MGTTNQVQKVSLLINYIDIIGLPVSGMTNQVQKVPISINYIDIISLPVSGMTNQVWISFNFFFFFFFHRLQIKFLSISNTIIINLHIIIKQCLK
jgi:hypothetical protein